SVRTLCRAIGIVALTVSFLGVLNTLLTGVVERMAELSLMRALGASRAQIFRLLATESLLLSLVGSTLGLLFVAAGGGVLEAFVRCLVPLAPRQPLLSLGSHTILECLALGLIVGLVACIYPAWRASRALPAEALKEG